VQKSAQVIENEGTSSRKWCKKVEKKTEERAVQVGKKPWGLVRANLFRKGIEGLAGDSWGIV